VLGLAAVAGSEQSLEKNGEGMFTAEFIKTVEALVARPGKFGLSNEVNLVVAPSFFLPKPGAFLRSLVTLSHATLPRVTLRSGARPKVNFRTLSPMGSLIDAPRFKSRESTRKPINF